MPFWKTHKCKHNCHFYNADLRISQKNGRQCWIFSTELSSNTDLLSYQYSVGDYFLVYKKTTKILLVNLLTQTRSKTKFSAIKFLIGSSEIQTWVPALHRHELHFFFIEFQFCKTDNIVSTVQATHVEFALPQSDQSFKKSELRNNKRSTFIFSVAFTASRIGQDLPSILLEQFFFVPQIILDSKKWTL